MKKVLIVLLFCTMAFGQKPQCAKPTPPPSPNPVTTTNSNTNNNNNSSNSSSNSASNSSSTSNSSGGNASSGGNIQQENYSVPRQAPPATGPTVFAGACLGAFSGGASAPVGGISFGGTKVDKVCQGINLAQVFLSHGNTTAAAKVLCSLKPAKDANLTLDECMAFLPEIQKPVMFVPAPPPTPVVVTPAAPTVVVEPIVVNPPAPVPVPIPAKVEPKPVPQVTKPVAHTKKPCAKDPVVPDSLKQPIQR